MCRTLALDLCYPVIWSISGSIGITWELERNAESQALPLTYQLVRTCVVLRAPFAGDPYKHGHLRSPALKQYRCLGPTSRDSDFIDLGCGLRIRSFEGCPCISNVSSIQDPCLTASSKAKERCPVSFHSTRWISPIFV